MKKYDHLKNLAELENEALIYVGHDYSQNDPHGLAEQFFNFVSRIYLKKMEPTTFSQPGT
ncbi:MAG: hypothetical protein JWN76_2443 [Chitinophagaceae bacterium]|nr:hypothetical protein [Chitinophagaceae bacterium]